MDSSGLERTDFHKLVYHLDYFLRIIMIRVEILPPLEPDTVFILLPITLGRITMATVTLQVL